MNSGTVYFVSRGIAPFHGVGGLERAAADVAGALRLGGQRVVLVAPQSDGFATTDEQIAVPWPGSMPSREIVQMSVAYAIWTRRVAQALAREVGPRDVLHLNGGTSVVAHLLRRRQLRARVVNPHGMEEYAIASPRDAVAYAWLRWAGRAGARAASAVVATDRAMVDSVHTNLRCETSKIVVIPNAVDVERLRLLAREGAELSNDLVGGRPRVVSIGRLVRNKGYDMMPDVIRDLLRSHPGVHWVHVGDGPLRTEITERAKQAGVEHACRLLSNLDDATAQAVLASADVFCQPSRYEGSSLTTLEALTHGLACVGTRVGGIPDKLRPGITGELADPNAPDIARAVARLLRDPELARRYGAAGRHLVDAEFSLSSAAEQYQQAYLGAIAR